ncbi:hypothetical protein RRG08_026260 [Elysia crispata]|uniref:Uncharacterized protein n=1 Tax=Elysia crispata TaxID=231223 RepID=A0AAE0ZAI6_9GAST|nr:hypothetical protein RRG08_026260 [Elysia crispata]
MVKSDVFSTVHQGFLGKQNEKIMLLVYFRGLEIDWTQYSCFHAYRRFSSSSCVQVFTQAEQQHLHQRMAAAEDIIYRLFPGVVSCPHSMDCKVML